MITNKEAVEVLKGNFISVQLHENESHADKFAEAFNMAIEALEKQVPKTPPIEGDGCSDGVLIYDTWFCPNCDKSYELEYEDYDYCPNCGQAIDWSD